MFASCTSLTETPALPATTLASGCYEGMFDECSGLTKAPALPATTLAAECYRRMFANCTGLTVAPALPATILASGCYEGMFNECSGLTEAPELPATTMDESCYMYMFSGCESLAKAPALPATALAPLCYAGMFQYCKSLTEAPDLPATRLEDECYQGMFYYCKNLSKITVNFTAWDEHVFPNFLIDEDWVAGVAPTGTFICPESLPKEYGTERIPEGWNVVYFDRSAVEDVGGETPFVWTEDLSVCVRHIGWVELYDLSGNRLCRMQGDAYNPVRLSLPAHGVYVVKTENKSVKVEL